MVETLNPTTDPTEPPVRPHTDLANRLATRFSGSYSPRWFAILGAVLDHDFGIHDRAGNRIISLAITSDGFVIGSSIAPDGSLGHDSLLGSADDLAANLLRFVNDIGPDNTPDRQAVWAAFSKIVDWRNQ